MRRGWGKGRQRDKQTDRQKGRHRDRQTNRQTERETDTMTDTKRQREREGEEGAQIEKGWGVVRKRKWKETWRGRQRDDGSNDICYHAPHFLYSTPPRWPSGKVSASRAEDPRFESPLCQDFFRVKSYQ